MQARISEIFLSYQGEGPFIGSKQLFIRFHGCNLKCVYCDTILENYKSFSKDSLLGKLLDFEDDYNELTLTGGEPLLYAEFLRGFLPLFKRYKMHKIYLETNGTFPAALASVIDYVDIVSMDFKLPSSTGAPESFWDAHERFIEIASKKDLAIKIIITDSTTVDDVKRMAFVLAKMKGNFPIILQPVTPVGNLVKEADEEMLSYFKMYVKKETGQEVNILGQVHKCIGVK